MTEQENRSVGKNFEFLLPREVEYKFVPRNPASMDTYRQESVPIEQYYLSMPSEPFSLRLREQAVNGGVEYEATLKDRGVMRPDGLDRLEVIVPVSPELYAYYLSEHAPIVRKLRSEPLPGVFIDYYEDGSVQIESENPASWAEFGKQHEGGFIEVTGRNFGDNEWRAYTDLFRRSGIDHREGPVEELDIEAIVQDITAQVATSGTATVHIGGRSGSGKSTIVRDIMAGLDALNISNTQLSTDDYHRGKTWLEQYNGGEFLGRWDEPIVYDTGAMAADLARLRRGESITRREIDWTTVEPRYLSNIEPTSVVIIEGIYAKAPEITMQGDLAYEMSTPLATCIGRRLLRDIKERPQFANPNESLRYMLSEAEPAYRRQGSSSAA